MAGGKAVRSGAFVLVGAIEGGGLVADAREGPPGSGLGGTVVGRGELSAPAVEPFGVSTKSASGEEQTLNSFYFSKRAICTPAKQPTIITRDTQRKQHNQNMGEQNTATVSSWLLLRWIQHVSLRRSQDAVGFINGT